MCICIHCYYIDRCETYHAVEHQHQQNHLTANPNFSAMNPTVNVNIRTIGDVIEMEWDVVGCDSFKEERGRWEKLRPGEPIPT